MQMKDWSTNDTLNKMHVEYSKDRIFLFKHQSIDEIDNIKFILVCF